MITGAGGFLGSQLAVKVAKEGGEILAVHHRAPNLRVSSELPNLRLGPLDITDQEAVNQLIGKFQPEIVFHLAGQAFVEPSWKDPHRTFKVNLTGTLNLLEALRHQSGNCVLAFAGSGSEYGRPDVVPTPEENALSPSSPYAISKAAADMLCRQYFLSYGLGVFRYRIFGTTGPGKRGDMCNDFASQIAARESDGRGGVIHVGNLDTRRDLLDVRDTLRALLLIVERGKVGEAYNVGSGIPREIRAILQELISLAHVRIEVSQESGRMRPADDPVLLADNGRLRGLGWNPEILFQQTLNDILSFWRSRAAPQ